MAAVRPGTGYWALGTFALLFATMCATAPQQKLSLDEKIGQLFSYGAHGIFMSESSLAYQQLGTSR